MSERTCIKEGRTHEFEFFDNDSTPSWKRYGKGCANLEGRAWSNEERDVIELVASETSWADGHTQKRDVTKKVYVTMTDDSARAFYNYLKSKFE